MYLQFDKNDSKLLMFVYIFFNSTIKSVRLPEKNYIFVIIFIVFYLTMPTQLQSGRVQLKTAEKCMLEAFYIFYNKSMLISHFLKHHQCC